MKHFTSNYISDEHGCPKNKRYLTILYSQHAVVKGKPQYVAMSCFGSTREEAIDKANSITDGRADAEIRRLKRVEKAKAAKAAKRGKQP